MFTDGVFHQCLPVLISREVEASQQGHFSVMTQPILNIFTQFLERGVQNFQSIGMELENRAQNTGYFPSGSQPYSYYYCSIS